jgi:hypothetical protein
LAVGKLQARLGRGAVRQPKRFSRDLDGLPGQFEAELEILDAARLDQIAGGGGVQRGGQLIRRGAKIMALFALADEIDAAGVARGRLPLWKRGIEGDFSGGMFLDRLGIPPAPPLKRGDPDFRLPARVTRRVTRYREQSQNNPAATG